MQKFRTLGMAIILVGFLILGGWAAQAETVPGKVLKFGIDADYPPWAWFEQGEFHGMDVEALRAIIEHFGLKVKFVALPWETAVPALGAGKIDLLAGAMYITCERDKILDYTSPYFRENGFVIVKKGSDLNIGTALCCGAKVAGMAGGTQHEWLKALADKPKTDLKPIAYETDELALKDLVAGRVDAMVSDEVVTYDYLEKYDIEVVGKIIKGYSHDVAYGVRQGDPDKLIPIIDKGLKWLWESGKWQALWAKHMNPKMSPLGPLPLKRQTPCD